jgi:hypothetical protein
MSDGLTATRTREHHDPVPDPGRRPAWVVAALQAAVVLVVFAVVGALAGWLWFHQWDVPSGVASGGQWYTDEAGLRDDFSGVAWYVAISLLAGLVLGALAAWRLDRSELVTLAAVLAGSALAAYLMLEVGQHLSGADPHVLARTAKDGTKLDGALRVRSWPPRGAFPFGALVGLGLVYGVSVSRTPTEVAPERTPGGRGDAPLEPSSAPPQV